MRRFNGGYQPKTKKPEVKQAVKNEGNVAQSPELDEIRGMVERHDTLLSELSNIVAELEHPGTPILKVKRLHPDAVLPTRGTEGSAGFDLYALEDVEIQPDGIGEIHTGIAMEMPKGNYYGLLLTRSSMGKRMVRLSAGANAAPDNDYRGEIVVYLTNDGIYPWPVRKGDRIGQVVVSEYLPCEVVETDELSETQRGAGGFGSTGR